MLGIRRELSFFNTSQKLSILSQIGGSPAAYVRADPPLEYWLAYIDAAGNAYKESPGAFGVEFKHLQP